MLNKSLLPKSTRGRWSAAIICLVIAFFYFHRVSKTITGSDLPYLRLYLESAALSFEPGQELAAVTFAEDILLIRAVQQSLLAHNPPGSPIPKGQDRRPQDLYNFERGGHCFDRAYTLAMLYRQLGYPTRHVALYRDDPAVNNFTELLRRDTRSHAAIEIMTKKGWLIVDTNHPFIGLDADGSPRSYASINANAPVGWPTSISPDLAWTVSGGAIVVYGLYSRHGHAFPPYNFIPDLNWRELLHNF